MEKLSLLCSRMTACSEPLYLHGLTFQDWSEEVKTLVAYVQPTDTGASHTELEKFLNDQLPHYMVPRMYVAIEEWPLNTSNKVMKQALPLPEVDDPQSAHGLL